MPRFLFQDFPLGNPCGVPYDSAMQRATLRMALDLFTSAKGPRTTVQTPFAWPNGNDWRTNYMRVDPSNVEQLRREGRERRDGQAKRKAKGQVRTT